jgi:predicted TIM-barrel fold metal-dependent hydrolase
MLIIDTHAHIYAADERRYPPIDKPLRPPKGKGTLGGLRAESAANAVELACLIQTSSFYRFDNRYICDSAKVSSDWAAGVCTLDPDDPHSPGLLAQYARDFGIKGMRSIPARDRRRTIPACARSGRRRSIMGW